MKLKYILFTFLPFAYLFIAIGVVIAIVGCSILNAGEFIVNKYAET